MEATGESTWLECPGLLAPEMGFCMEMIPVLKDTVFKYVVVDSVHVKPKGGKMRREDIMYKPHIADRNSAS